MRIIASQVALTASTAVTRATSESLRGRFWIGKEPATDNVQMTESARNSALSPSPAIPTLQAQSTRQGLGASASNNRRGTNPGSRNLGRPEPSSRPLATTNNADSAVSADSSKELSAADDDAELLASPEGAKLLVMRRLLEAMTGKAIRVAKPEDVERGQTDEPALAELDQQATSGPMSQATNQEVTRTGWGLELEIERIRIETTSVKFAAAGTIVTEDGKAIAFDASFVKEGELVNVERLSLREGDAKLKDPLVLLYSGTHAELTQDAQAFDLDANGTLENLPGIANGAYIVQDLNANGRVDDGRELLGALSGDGFAELRAMDDDANGFVDSSDDRFNQLYLWEPGGGGSNLTSLADAGLLGLYSGNISTPFELRATSGELQGRVRSTGIYVTENGTVRPMEQIDVKV